MTNVQFNPATEKAEQVAKGAPVVEARAKPARTADTIGQARKGKDALSEQTLADNPLASPNVAAPKTAGSSIWDYPFPGPGLVYYAAQANVLQLSTDMQAMGIYTQMEKAEYTIVNQALDQQAIKEQATIMAQATGALWNAAATVGMGLGGTIGGGIGIYKTGNLAKDMNKLEIKRGEANAQLGKTFEVNPADAEVGVNDELENEELPIEERQNIALRNLKSKLNDIRELRSLATTKDDRSWEEKVQDYFFGQHDDISREDINNYAPENFGEGSVFNRLSNEVAGMSEASKKELLDSSFESYQKIRTNNPEEAETVAINEGFDAMETEAKGDYALIKDELKLAKNPIQRALDELDLKIEKNKQKATEAQTYVTMFQGIGQLANTLQGGAYYSAVGQADATFAKTKAQQVAQINEAIRQEIARQWSSLAQATDQSLQSFTAVVREINSVNQRA